MTVAEQIIKRHDSIRLVHAIAGTIVSLALIVTGFCLTQRQVDSVSASSATEASLSLRELEFKANSTYPGITMIVCGTAVACCLLLKRYRAKTQHKDESNPGFTEVQN